MMYFSMSSYFLGIATGFFIYYTVDQWMQRQRKKSEQKTEE